MGHGIFVDNGSSIRRSIHIGSRVCIGSSTNVHVTMSSASGTSEEAPKGGYLFEASVDGESLLAMARGHDEDLHFTLVDVDGRTDGDAFWEAGTEMSDLLSKA